MLVTETLKDGLKRGYTIKVTAAELEEKVHDKLVEAQPDVEMKGFRKGKVPLGILKQRFGQRLLGDAMQESIDGAVKEHFDNAGERPALRPEIKMVEGETWNEGDDVVVEMSYEALPEIPEVDLAGITLEKMTVTADETAVDEALEQIARSAGTFTDREEGAAAEDGDQVTLDFKGMIDGEEFEGGAAEDHALVIGSKSFIPGFEEQLIGVKAGDAPEITVTFPEDYRATHLAGKEAVFACTIKAVKAPQPAELDDELAKKFGADDLAALREQITARIEQEYVAAARAVMKRKLLDELDGLVSFELPEQLVEAEAKQVAHQLWHEEHPDEAHHEHGEITPTDEQRTLAERRVRLGLLLAEIGNKAEITVTDAEMTQAVVAAARHYPGQERAYFEFVQKNPQIQQQLRAPVFEDKVVDHIFEQASISEKPVTKKELQEAVDALDEI